MAIVSELITKFKFAGNLSPLTNFNKGLGTGTIKGFAFVGAISAIAVAFGKMAHNTLRATDQLVQLSRSTGVGIESIQQLGFAASVSGSSVKAMESTIDSLTKKIGDASLKGSSDFQRIGVAIRSSTGEIRKADDVLLDISRRFRELNLTMAQQKSLAGSLGIDASLVQLLSKSTDEIDRLRDRSKKFGLLTQSNADSIANYNDKLTELSFRFTALKRSLAVQVAPAILTVIQGLEVFAEAIKRIGVFVVDFVKEFKGLSIIIGAVAAAFVIMNSPIAAGAAAIAGLILVFDDLIVAFKGGDSAIKRWVAPFFDLEKVLQRIVNSFRLIGELRKKAFTAVKDKYVGSVKKLFNQTPVNRETNNNVEQNINIDIRSDNPDAVGERVQDSLQRQLENAELQFSRGGV